MEQSKWESFEETIVQVVTGFICGVSIQMTMFPIFGIHNFSLLNNVYLTAIFTAASMVRSYLIRRFYNKRRGFFTRLIRKIK